MPYARMNEWVAGKGSGQQLHFRLELEPGWAHPELKKRLDAVANNRWKKYVFRALEKPLKGLSLLIWPLAAAGTRMRHRAESKNGGIQHGLNEIALQLRTGKILRTDLIDANAEERRIFDLLKKHSELHPHFYVRTFGGKLIVTSIPSRVRAQALTHLRDITAPASQQP